MKDDPAFVVDTRCMESDGELYRGLTKRELFAAMAMQGMLAGNTQTDARGIHVWAVTFADALIAELEKK